MRPKLELAKKEPAPQHIFAENYSIFSDFSEGEVNKLAPVADTGSSSSNTPTAPANKEPAAGKPEGQDYSDDAATTTATTKKEVPKHGLNYQVG